MKCRNDATEQCTCAGVEDYCPHLDDEGWKEWEETTHELLYDNFTWPIKEPT